MKNKGLILIFVVIALVVAYFVWQYKKLMNYTATIRRVNFAKFSLDEITGKIYIDFYNPSNINLTFKDIDISMTINNIEVTKLEAPDKTDLPADSVTTIAFDFQIIPKHILSIRNVFALKGILNKDKVLFGFNGQAYFQKELLTVKIPININEPLSYYLSE